MPRGKKTRATTQESRTLRRSTRSNRPQGDVVPDVYKELLLETVKSSPMKSDDEGRTVKRRRVGERVAKEAQDIAGSDDETVTEDPPNNTDDLFEGEADERQIQTIYDDFMESEDDDDEDEDFEDVDLEASAQVDITTQANSGDINISLNPVQPSKTPTVPRRKPVGTAERKLRLQVHQAHVLCLLAHSKCRNSWCNDLDVQAALKPLLSRQTIALLHEDEAKSQFQRDHSWTKGIEACCEIFAEHFEINSPGLRRAFWREDGGSNLDSSMFDENTLMDRDDFKHASRRKIGSRDIGAQLFCALLRSVAVDARLVFSLQPLPFSGVAKGVTPEKPKPKYIYASNLHGPSSGEGFETMDDGPHFLNPRRRIGQPDLGGSRASAPARPPVLQKKKIVDSPYPIFWVEAFNEATQKWIALDPIVRHTINKPKTGFEPPASDRLNSMSYVIAFEEDGTARDVTLRYARHYNAKTRKMRIESTKGGVQWWDKAMSIFSKSISEARDEIEDAELAAREAAEEMPRNVQDFKDHPRYALERHLRRNEAIWPLKEVGKVSPGMGKDAKLESIYRRSDVHIVRSADQWYRKGRDVKVGEQPLKRVVPKRKRGVNLDDMDEEDEDLQDGTRLYAEFQTNIYVPPPVIKGRIPKNAYGNIDVYVSSMIPPGGVHIQHPETARAAKVLGIDYADAVTGFEFKGRQGTAVVKGIVISAEYCEAVTEILRSFNDAKARAIEQARTNEALNMWKKFLIGLRVNERVKEYEVEGKHDQADHDSEDREEPDDPADEDYEESGGGFFPEDGGGGFIAEPRMAVPRAGDDNDGEGGGFMVGDGQGSSLSAVKPSSHPSSAVERLEQSWRLEKINLDAGIIITESPHTSKPPAKPTARIAAAEIDTPSKTNFPPIGVPAPPQVELVVKTKPAISDKPTAPIATLSDPTDNRYSTQLEIASPQETRDKEEEEEDGSKNGQGSKMPKMLSMPSSQDSIIEKGSLLSEDPEDEDADPEWLD